MWWITQVTPLPICWEIHFWNITIDIPNTKKVYFLSSKGGDSRGAKEKWGIRAASTYTIGVPTFPPPFLNDNAEMSLHSIPVIKGCNYDCCMLFLNRLRTKINASRFGGTQCIGNLSAHRYESPAKKKRLLEVQSILDTPIKSWIAHNSSFCVVLWLDWMLPNTKNNSLHGRPFLRQRIVV